MSVTVPIQTIKLIYLLVLQGYTETSISPTFPNLPIIELIPQLVQKAIDEGTSKMQRDLRTICRVRYAALTHHHSF